MNELRGHLVTAERSASEQDNAKGPLQIPYELESGIDRGELAAGYTRHEMPVRM